MPKISVIIPVHNSEHYLPQCLDSLIAQTFGDYEILLMENFSSDNTYEVAEGYALKDSRIKLFKLDKKGICNARNEGLKRACGDYIVFMDNDDLASSDHLMALYECVGEGSGCEMGIAPFAGYWDGGKIKPKIYGFGPGVYNGDDKRILFGERVVWSRIYSRRIIEDNNVRFDESVEAVEDWPFFVEMLLLSGSVSVTDKSCYYYRQGRAGQASGASSFKSVKKNLLAFELVDKLLRRHGVYDIYESYYNNELAKEIMGKTFGATPFKRLSAGEVVEIIEPIKGRLLELRLDDSISPSWLRSWYSRFQFFLSRGRYGYFFKVMRLYRNVVYGVFGRFFQFFYKSS